MKLMCFVRGIINSIKTGYIVSGHDYKEIYNNKDLQILECEACGHISVASWRKHDKNNI